MTKQIEVLAGLFVGGAGWVGWKGGLGEDL